MSVELLHEYEWFSLVYIDAAGVFLEVHHDHRMHDLIISPFEG